MNKDFLIGAGAGLLVNRTIQKTTQDFWLKEGVKARDSRLVAYNQAIKEGKTQEQANEIALQANPAWLKLGSNRMNGLATTVIGAIVYFGNKKVGSGIVAAGAAKVIYPARAMDLDFTFK